MPPPPGDAPAGRSRRPSVLAVVAHPDDETISFSVGLARAAADCVLLTATDGAPRNPRFLALAGCSSREELAAARRAEQREAVALAGVPPERCLTLDFIDLEAASRLVDLTLALRDRIDALRPERVFTHPYEGGHPD